MLGHLVVSAKVSSTSAVAPLTDVSDEELALLLEGTAEQILGPQRTLEIKEQLLTQPDLYVAWLSMQQDSGLIEASSLASATGAAPAQTSKPGLLAGLIDGVSGFLTPQVGLASACSFALALLLGWHLLPQGLAPKMAPVTVATSDTAAPATKASSEQLAMAPVMMEQGINAPERAAVGFRASSQTEAIVDRALGATFECHDMKAAVDAEVCFSNTRHLQHWFYVQAPNQFSALPALVDAEKILTVATNKHHILVEYTQDAEFKLALFDTTVVDGKLKANKVFEDNAGADGYFDGVRLDSNGLRYQVNGPTGTEPRQYSYGQP